MLRRLVTAVGGLNCTRIRINPGVGIGGRVAPIEKRSDEADGQISLNVEP